MQVGLQHSRAQQAESRHGHDPYEDMVWLLWVNVKGQRMGSWLEGFLIARITC